MLVFQRNTLYVVILTCHGNVCERDEVRDGHHLKVALKTCNMQCANSRVDRHNTRLIYAKSTAQHPTQRSHNNSKSNNFVGCYLEMYFV